MPDSSDNQALINWATVTTNVTGLVLGTAVLGMFGGIGYLVVKLPSTLEQILRNQESIRTEITRANKRIDSIEFSDKQQQQLIFRLLSR